MMFASLVLHGAIDIAVGVWCLLVERVEGRFQLAQLSVSRLLRALGTTALIGSVYISAMTLLWANFFGVIRLLFVDVLVVAPVLGVVTLVRALSGRQSGSSRALCLTAAVLLLLCGVAGVYGHYIEPFRLQLETPTVHSGHLSKPLRIAILTDLQTDQITDYEKSAIDRLLATKPDLILVPGDLFQGYRADFARELTAVRALLSRLQAPLGVFAVIGNCDRTEEFLQILEGTSIEFMHGETRVVSSEWGEIVLGGIGYVHRESAVAVFNEVGAMSGPGRLSLLQGHDLGLVFDAEAPVPPNLLVGGHTHGGQIQLPWFGALMTLSRLPLRFAEGLHDLGRSSMYISRGVGVERGQAPRIRFLCPPEITLLTVVPVDTP